ncbi:MAG: hypothetical protein KKD39_00955, partial [Candidatus Altiarchaeota archaeon]|nr:hypothetical protein [Candidatus Altiarchaeota archaeon]
MMNLGRLTKRILDYQDELLKDRFKLYSIVATVFVVGFVLSIHTSMFVPAAGYFDDVENLHASWLVYRGYIPYRDFFEHHTPLTWYVLSPLFNFYMDDIRIL